MEWISVKDRLPDDRQDVIVFANGFVHADVIYSIDEGFEFYERGAPTNVTHWMPLPEPPKNDAK